MSAREIPNMRAVWLAACSVGRTILFRLNTGMAWVSGGGKVTKRADGAAVVPFARPIPLGFGRVDNRPVVGAADLIGWHTVRITADMIGCRVAVFTSVEVKRPSGGVTSDDQVNWRDQVREAGGIAVVANTPSVAQAFLSGWRPPRDDSVQNQPPAPAPGAD